MPLIDTHCHLNAPPLGDDPRGVLDRAASAGVDQVVVPAYDRASWQPVQALAAAHAGVHAALGLHPWVALDEGEEPSLISGMGGIKDQLAAAIGAAAAPVVAIGEIGLDTKIEAVDLPRQQAVLAAQLELAADLDLPVILHCRGAYAELLSAIARHHGKLRGVFHAFSRGIELAEQVMAAGLHLGLGGAVTRPQARVHRILPRLPLDRIVLETDAPSIGLDGIPPAETEPRHVRDIATVIAAARGETLQTIAEATTAHARALFNLPD